MGLLEPSVAEALPGLFVLRRGHSEGSRHHLCTTDGCSRAPISAHDAVRDIVAIWISKDLDAHNEVKHAKKCVAFVPYRDPTVIAAAQPPRKSSGTLAAWTSPVVAPDEVHAKPLF